MVLQIAADDFELCTDMTSDFQGTSLARGEWLTIFQLKRWRDHNDIRTAWCKKKRIVVHNAAVWVRAMFLSPLLPLKSGENLIALLQVCLHVNGNMNISTFLKNLFFANTCVFLCVWYFSSTARANDTMVINIIKHNEQFATHLP